MRLNIQLAMLLLVLLGLSSCKKTNQDILYNKKYVEEIKKVRRETALFMGRNFIPGATVAVAKNGEIIYSEGIGMASKDLEVKATRKTKFRIGIVSELITNLVYHKMIEDGIVNPDSSVQTYYPEFPKKDFTITLNNLAQQTSGLREPNNKEQNWRGLNVSLEKGLDSFKDDPLLFGPGMYQNPTIFNYNLLGLAMEKASGKRFDQLLQDYVTDTLGMKNTVVDNPFRTIKGRTDFFDHNMISQIINATFYDLRHRAPSSGILSNAEDLAKFANAILYSDYLSDETRLAYFTPETLSNNMKAQTANGWMLLFDRKGRKLYGKEGSVTGGSAAILIYPEESLVVTYATNLAASLDDSPVFDIAKHFLPADEEKEEDSTEKDK